MLSERTTLARHYTAAQCGDHSEGRQSYGHAIIIDPWGTVLAKLEDPERGVGIATAEIDLDWLEDVRTRIPVETHRRPLNDPSEFSVTVEK